MNNWDNHRFFLAVARQTSIAKAAQYLGVNRSTVLRRITAFEKTLGVRLFERLPTGYFTTPAGDEVMALAIEMEATADRISRRIAGQDQKLSGSIQISLPGAVAKYILLDDLARFTKENPEICLKLLNTYDMLDLSRREADVAVRISNDPPDSLIGRRIVKVAKAIYMSKIHLDTAQQRPDYWLGWSPHSSGEQWLEESPFPHTPIGAVVTDPLVTIEALKAGMGMTVLPCFMGDEESELCRVPGTGVLSSTDLWILTHKDLRKTARIRKFADFISVALKKRAPLLEGKSYQ